MKVKNRILAVLLCTILLFPILAIPTSAAPITPPFVEIPDGGPTSNNTGTYSDMETLAFVVYKAIARISIFLAMLSLASCAWKYLGAIFFGNYASMGGSDMVKAQKQVIYTILYLMFILLLPVLIKSAISFFKNGGGNFGLKPWSPEPVK